MMDYYEMDESCPHCGHDIIHWGDCEAGCDDGFFNLYDEDPLWYDEDDIEGCEDCFETGIQQWCPKCGKDPRKKAAYWSRSVELEKFKVGLQYVLESEMVDTRSELMREDYADWLRESILLKVRGYVWSERVDVIKFRKPTTWWQMFKEAYAPDWFLERWPVVCEVKTIDIRVKYPDFRPSLPDQEYRWWVTESVMMELLEGQ
jgi:hypothetical protein